jgi:hypothetical protein
MRRLRIVALASLTAVMLAALAAPALAARPGFVFPGICCYHDGDVVRTVTPPSAFPNGGTDPFYAVMGGADGQLAVVGVAPGDAGYRGGHWAFNAVTWNTVPYVLTSDEAVLAAAAAGDVTITRVPANDFLCPIQP